MSNLCSIELRIRGEWRDVWLYKEKIYLWDRSGQLAYVGMEEIRKSVYKRFGRAQSVALQSLVFRNDWKVGEQLKQMLEVPEMEQAFVRPFAHGEGVVQVEVPEELLKWNDSEAYSEPVLDTCIFANRVYLGTLDGLLESYVHPNQPKRYMALISI